MIPPGQLEVEMARIEEARIAEELNLEAQEADPPINSPYYLPLTIHIVRKSDKTGGFTLEKLAVAMRDLNRLWEQVGVQFFIYGGIDYIDSDTHFNLPNSDSDADKARRNALRQTNVVANTINVYFTNLAGNLAGESSYSSDAVQGILMDLADAGIPGDPSTFAHEVGHYFDLYHTHGGWRDSKGNLTRIECPTRDPKKQNCDTNGDLLCDTPADPDLSGRVMKVGDDDCAYNGSAMLPSGCDSTPYNPPTRNIMSYSTKLCSTQRALRRCAGKPAECRLQLQLPLPHRDQGG
jgi:hypothetical protein